MKELIIERYDSLATGNNMQVMRIGGFEEGELAELKSLEHGKARHELFAMLDKRNNNLGSRWMRENGVYGLWFDNEYAYLNVGIRKE